MKKSFKLDAALSHKVAVQEIKVKPVAVEFSGISFPGSPDIFSH